MVMAEETKDRYINSYTDYDFDKLIGSDLKLDSTRICTRKFTPPSRLRDTLQHTSRRRQLSTQALRLLESVCDLTARLFPKSEARGFTVISRILEGDTLRTISRDLNITTDEAESLATNAISLIDQLASRLGSMADFRDQIKANSKQAIAAEKQRAERQTVALRDELARAKEELSQLRKDHQTLEQGLLPLLSDPVRRSDYLSGLPIHKFPISPDLQSLLLRQGFCTMGDLLQLSAYDLIFDYGLSRPQAEQLDTIISGLGLTRKQ